MKRSGADLSHGQLSILPAGWPELQPLLDLLLEAVPESRASLLAQFSAGSVERRDKLAALLEECERELPLLAGTALDRFDILIADEPEPPTPELLGGRYRMGAELGRGGMALVYAAEDLKHARAVAVKVIRPELAALLGRDRFLREIAIIARLRHPNIIPLFDSGDDDGLLYFVMPRETGASLRQRLDDGPPLAISDVVSVLRDIARALAYAHEQGVVHRDVKPDNVMLSGGAAVVTDFGIAEALSAARHDPSRTTHAGAGMGTPAYMAPEQARGDPVSDHRADIYAFGCVAYELLAGHPPFVGTSSHAIVAEHVTHAPLPLFQARQDIPPAIAQLVEHCLEKDPAARPQCAQEILDVLSAMQSPTTRVARSDGMTFRRLWWLLAGASMLGVLLVLLLRGRRDPSGDVGIDYLIAKTMLDRRGQNIEQSIEEFRNVLAKDSLSGDAASGLAFALALSPYFHPVPAASVAAEATSNARKAIKLAPKLAQPHTALGLVYMHDRRWELAEEEFGKAIDLQPRDVEAHVQLGRFLLMRDRPDEALRQFQTAEADDRVSAVTASWTAYAHFLLGHLDSAQTQLARATRVNSANVSTASLGGLILHAIGRRKEARRLVDGLPPLREAALYVIAAGGDTATAHARMRTIEAASPRPWMAETARAYLLLGLGDTARAIDAFAKASAAKELWPMLHPTRDPMFDGVRGNPRFRALLRAERLPDNVPSARESFR